MKVAPKLVLAAWLAFQPMLGLHAWLSVRRQEALFRAQSERGLALLGEHLRQIVATEWMREGRVEVSALLASAAAADRDVEIDWLPPDPNSGGRSLDDSKPDRLLWLEPVAIAGEPVGRIAISESLVPMHRYVRESLLHLGVLTFALGVAGVAVSSALGERWVGGRLRQLMDFARRIGSGGLGASAEVRGHDEISELAATLGEMSRGLTAAHAQTVRAEAERVTMLQQLRHADRLAGIGRLASSISHELGTPLNVAMGHASRIEKEPAISQDVRHSAQVILRQIDRMATTLHGILGFARRNPARTEPVDLTATVAQVVDLFAPLIAEHRMELKVASETSDACVQGNVIQLEQAISNLISNAIDATRDIGPIEVTIARTLSQRTFGNATVVEVRVRDHGPGVAAADRERIFEPFFTSKPEGSGTGLGLWITQGIANDHGGSLRLEDPSDGGACFVLSLPARKGTES